ARSAVVAEVADLGRRRAVGVGAARVGAATAGRAGAGPAVGAGVALVARHGLAEVGPAEHRRRHAEVAAAAGRGPAHVIPGPIAVARRAARPRGEPGGPAAEIGGVEAEVAVGAIAVAGARGPEAGLGAGAGDAQPVAARLLGGAGRRPDGAFITAVHA